MFFFFHQTLLGFVRDELLTQVRPGERHDHSVQPYENYQVDYDLFKLIFLEVSPWGQGAQAEDLAARIFRVSQVLRLLSSH